MTAINRRHFLAGLGAASGALTLSTMSHANETKRPHRLLIVNVGGGWDISYALDPKPQLQTVDTPEGSVEEFAGIPVLVHESRPSIRSFFEGYGASSVVINGIDVKSISHITCAERMFTGYTGTARPDAGAMVGHELAAELPMPYLVLGGVAFPGDLSVSTGRVGDVNQLSGLLPGRDFFDHVPEFRHGGFASNADDDARVRAFLERRIERHRAQRGAQGANRRRIDDFAASLSKSDAVRSRADQFGSFGFSFAMEQQVDFAIRAFREDLSWTATVDSGVDWDTHGYNALQSENHEALFAGLDYLAGQLASTPGSSGSSLLDETIVLVASEMSRTPKLNAAEGKDHWPVTSALMFGGAVRGGRVLGTTNDLVEAFPVDFETGSPVDVGLQLEPRHLLAGVLEAAGADPSLYFADVEVFRAPFI